MKPGDKVTMNNRYYVSEHNKRRVFEVTSEPQKVGKVEYVWLKGFRGCYAMDGLDLIEERK